tara:strand:+ start:760 stop:3402 length:2643 start_codon:yes stop_codon:yes gene_type:complete
MSKTSSYNHKIVEKKIYSLWEKKRCFKPIKNKKNKKFVIVIPPPNITGSLHMGHALNNSIQDLLIRYHRNKGIETLWQPGTDHAGIATQLVVEKQLNEKNIRKQDLGRDKFINEIWKWKRKSGNAITLQLKKLGSSCDWSRERFTMDKGLSQAVTKVFVDLYNKKLIYKDLKLTNWDPKLKTAISDLEVNQKDVNGKLYYIKYYLEGSHDFLVIATTRPETLFGDTAVAVNPGDERYLKYLGKKIKIPISNRSIEIISDEYADPTQGSGVVKITPAHDYNDYDVGKRKNLELINIMNKDGTLNKNVPKNYQNLDRFEAREKIIKELNDLEQIEKIADIKHTVPFGDRSGVVVEPLLTKQWFLDAKKIAKNAIVKVKNKETVFYPVNWSKTYFQWMENIEPWCISRQLWWGHQIPAWYTKNNEIIVAENKKEAEKIAKKKFGQKKITLEQDKDVLDTWFSSALWPFATMDWPKKNYELNKYYPSSVLVTGFDIIFFWVARMMMMGLFFMKKVPFRKVYVHALVRDEKGQKMSKSKGNVIDPLNLINLYGADSLRFTLIAMSSPGRDVKLSTDRVKGYRNFLTKIWNIFAYSKKNHVTLNKKIKLSKLNLPINFWIINELEKHKKLINKSIENYRFDEAAKLTYQYIWDIFCDWYLEFTKPIFQSKIKKDIEETKNVLLYIQKEILFLLHPFMPFITEELWIKHNFKKIYGKYLINYNNPDLKLKINKKTINNITFLRNLILEIRSVKSRLSIIPGSKIDLGLKTLNKKDSKLISDNIIFLSKLARINKICENIDKNFISIIVDGRKISIRFEDSVDINKQKLIIDKKISKLMKIIEISQNKLNNSSFIQKAPKDIIDKEKELLKSNSLELDKLKEIINTAL